MFFANESIGETMQKVIVFDLGGTLMEFRGMPLNWSDHYYQGFKNVKDANGLDLSEAELQKSAEILESYNPRISGREIEIAPEIMFDEAIADWPKKPVIGKAIEDFFAGLGLISMVFDFSVDVIKKCKNVGHKVACLSDLPNGMPDNIFLRSIVEIADLFDLYVSSQSCGFRKPNKEGLLTIARSFDVDISELLFVGEEGKDCLTAQNAGCKYMFIKDFLKSIA